MNFVRCILTSLIVLYTVDEVNNCFPKTLTQGKCYSMLIQKVNHCHQELPIVDFVLDSKSTQSMCVQDVYNILVLHIFLIELSQDIESTLPGYSIPWILQVLKQGLNDQIFGLLSFFAISLVNKAILKHLHHTQEARVSDIVMAHLEECFFYELDYPPHSFGNGWVFVSVLIDHVELELRSHVAK
jgi:hypothetical protein